MYKNVWRGPNYKTFWNGEIDHITLPKNQFGMDNDYVVADINISIDSQKIFHPAKMCSNFLFVSWKQIVHLCYAM